MIYSHGATVAIQECSFYNNKCSRNSAMLHIGNTTAAQLSGTTNFEQSNRAYDIYLEGADSFLYSDLVHKRSLTVNPSSKSSIQVCSAVAVSQNTLAFQQSM